MKKSPNLDVCTAEEWADWLLQEVKAKGGVVMFDMHNLLTARQLHTLVNAYRIVGQREGYKKGKRDGSQQGFRIGYDKGYKDGRSDEYAIACEELRDRYDAER